MKNIIIICFFLLGESITAQSGIIGTNFTYQKISENEYNFTFHTFFNLGAGTTCPPLVNYTFATENDTFLVKAYYDTTGVWPAMGCERTDTVVYNSSLPQNVTYIKMSTNEITYNNTPPYDPPIMTVEDVYFHIFDLNLSNNNFNTDNNYNVVYPNPTQGSIFISNDIDFEKIAVINNLGQIILRLNKNKSGNYDLINMQNGLYYLVYYNSNMEKIGVSKLLKIN